MAQDIQTNNDLNNMMIKNQKIEIYATRDGEQIHKETREAHIILNYITGDFFCGIQQRELQLLSDEELPEDIERSERPYFKITGKMPAEQMIYDKSTDQRYKVDMNVIIRDQTVPIVFDVLIKNYKQANGGFRQFICSADFDYRDIGITEFAGYNPEVKLVVSFQAYKKSN
jgi:hypothetical protein